MGAVDLVVLSVILIEALTLHEILPVAQGMVQLGWVGGELVA